VTALISRRLGEFHILQSFGQGLEQRLHVF